MSQAVPSVPNGEVLARSARRSGDMPPGHPYKAIRAQPSGDSMPELWILGSTKAGAHYAAELGWAFCFAHFISTEGPEDIISYYKAHFQPSPRRDGLTRSFGRGPCRHPRPQSLR